MTAIPFATKAWPVVTGCSRLKSGCRECYAARLAATRLKHHEHYKGLAEYRGGRGHWIAPPRFNADILDAPLHWRKPRRVFVAHTGDLFHESVPRRQIRAVWHIMSKCPQHTFMVFTKRWERAQELLSTDGWKKIGMLPNVWLVHSASTQAEVDECAPYLVETPAAKRGLSLEPLLEHIDLEQSGAFGIETYHDAMSTGDGTGIVDLPGMDFVIAGAETSLRNDLARPCPNGAPQSLLKQCQAAGVPFWFKGWGNHMPDGQAKHTLDGVVYESLPDTP